MPMRPLILVVACFACSCRSAADRRLDSIRTNSILLSLHHATRYIDSARDLLATRDPAGDKDQIAAAVLVHTPLGDSLRSAVLGLIDRCHACWPNPATIANVDNAFHYSRQLTSSDAWYGQDFNATPTSTAYTLLTTMEDECTRAANFTMFRIDGHPR